MKNETLIQVRGGAIFQITPADNGKIDLHDPQSGDYSGTVTEETLATWDPKPAVRHADCYCSSLYRSTCDFCSGLRS